ncbi:Ubiquinone biosynthesis protein coq9, mitochondrial [Chytriomyces hyalinus]|nr:Ubiquinone biosynthesis protein coq9, mitochondrial [Chytriomyces hyalinus]
MKLSRAAFQHPISSLRFLSSATSVSFPHAVANRSFVRCMASTIVSRSTPPASSPPDVSRIAFTASNAIPDDSHAHSPTAISKNALLARALLHVPSKGFNNAAIVEACTDLNLSHMAAGLCQRGPVELVDFFVADTTRAVAAQMADMDMSTMRIPQKIRTGVLLRIDRLKPVIQHWPDALALMAMPQNAPYALKNLGHIVDEIWFAAGDRSTDLNWYSKRTLLAGVYTSTELFMCQDKSPNFAETEKFLDRRLQDVAFIGRTTNEVSNIVQFGVKSALGVLASRGFRV